MTESEDQEAVARELAEQAAAARDVYPDQHPAWCDRSLCTVDFEAFGQVGWTAHRGLHRSAPVTIGADSPSGTRLTVRMRESVAPWMCETYVEVVPQGREGDALAAIKLNLDDAVSAIAALTQLADAGRAARDVAVQHHLARYRKA